MKKTEIALNVALGFFLAFYVLVFFLGGGCAGDDGYGMQEPAKVETVGELISCDNYRLEVPPIFWGLGEIEVYDTLRNEFYIVDAGECVYGWKKE